MPPPPALKKKLGTKNPPIFSQEYLIQNHGKIILEFLNKFSLFSSQVTLPVAF